MELGGNSERCLKWGGVIMESLLKLLKGWSGHKLFVGVLGLKEVTAPAPP